MRAVRFHAFGEPSVLGVEEIAGPPLPVGDQLLVRVDASSVNGTDLGLRRGGAKIATVGRMPFVPGFDLAGEVVRCGPNVTAFSPGDRVFALLGHSGGAQAEQVLLRQGRAALSPSSCSAAEAAAIPLAGLTALQALYGLAGLPARRTARVLVLGAAGGIGSFAVQLAKLVGARVTGSASGNKLDFVQSLGADEVIDRRQHAVSELGQRWDVILDASGRYGFAELKPVLEPDGVLVSTRPISVDALRILTPAPLRPSGPRFAAVMTRARSQDLAHLAALVDRGLLRPAVDQTYPLTEVVEAHRHAEEARGKVVLELT